MAYQTLYRKYRPKNFNLVFGQDIIVKTLKNVIKNDKLSHAYLFTGPRGTGKTSCAKLFAKAVNCLNNESGDVCNECDVCKTYNENSNPDIIEIDAASNNGVDEIREIKNKISLVPSLSRYKVYIIDEVHMLSIGAFNALLKTLEEPPNYVIFILATTEPQKLPATVISRCQRFDFKNIAAADMKKCLNNIISKENIIIEDDAIDEIIQNSKGGMRDAIGLLDQAYAFADDKITKNDIIELSGSINNDFLFEIFDSIKKSNYEKIFFLSEKIEQQGKDFNLVIEKMLSFVRKKIIQQKMGNVVEAENNDLNVLNSVSIDKLFDIINILSNMQFDINKSYHKKVIFEINIIQLINNVFYSNKHSFEEKEKINQNINVPRETLNNEKKYLKELKEVRINNILKESMKQELNSVINIWNDIKKYLYDSKYKICAGILTFTKPVAASKKGIIVTCPQESSLIRLEDNYDESRELLNLIFKKNYKIVFITEKYWESIRPKYVEKVRKNMLEIIDEEEYLQKLISNKDKKNNHNSFEEFNDLIIMEE